MIENIAAAAKRIEPVVNHTPVMTSRTLNNMTGAEVYIKCENFQRIGAFKFRGAYNAISQLSPEEKARGVITHSSGNHAQAVALASKLLGVKATIVMPANSPAIKRESTKGYGADIVLCKSDERERKAEEIIREKNHILIHPYENPNVVYGAGTAAYELISSHPLDMVLAPVGGGGLLSGTSIAVKGLSPSTQVYGIEPENADDARRSFKSGNLILLYNPNTIADGLRTCLGTLTFNIIRKNVDDIITVKEMDIIEAMRFYYERMKIVVEPSGAVSLAGLLSGKLPVKNKRIGLIISGGNIDLSSLFELLEKQVEEINNRLKAH